MSQKLKMFAFADDMKYDSLVDFSDTMFLIIFDLKMWSSRLLRDIEWFLRIVNVSLLPWQGLFLSANSQQCIYLVLGICGKSYASDAKSVR